MDVMVTDAPDKHRYEARVNGELVGFAEYRRTEELVVFTHTEVSASHAGQGIAGALARTALDEARQQHLPVVPECSYVRGWIERHPDYAELVYQGGGSTPGD